MSFGSEVTEDDISTFLNKFKAAEKKVDQLQYIGLRFEHVETLPESTFDALTLLAQPLIRSPHHLLLTSVFFNYLRFYLPLLPPTPSRHVHLAVTQLLPGVLEKLNDPKERIHEPATECAAVLGQKAAEADAACSEHDAGLGGSKSKETLLSVWERGVKESLVGKNLRGKMQAMKVILQLREKVKGSLKPWLAPMVDLLEDGDGQVREAAREAMITMLSPADVPAAARTELKKLLAARNVRKSIAEPMLARILGGAMPNPADFPLPPDEAMLAPAKPSVAGPADDVPVVYIASARDLETEFSKMLPHFEGKETEHNWTPREKAVVRIRGMLRGDAHKDYHDAFLAGLKSGVFEGVSRTIVSLRTTVSQQSCALMLELAEQLGSSFDGFVEGFLPVLGKMAGYTKKIIAEKSQKVVTAIITHSTAQPRIFIAHISAGAGDKNVQTRQYSASHLKTFLDTQAARCKSSIDQGSFTEQLESLLKKALADVNPQTRETARLAYWSFAPIWPARAKGIIEGLDGQARKQLEKAQAAHGSAALSTAGPTNGTNGTMKPAPVQRPRTGAAAFIAEQRRLAKLAGSKQETAQSSRVVSNPAPPSPSIAQASGMPRSASTHSFETPARRGMGVRAETTPDASPSARRGGSTTNKVDSPVLGRSSAKSGAVPIPSSTSAASARSRSSSLARTISRSPPAQPVLSSRTPLRGTQSRSTASAQLSPTASTSTASLHTVQTPVLARKSVAGTHTAQERLYVSSSGSPLNRPRPGIARSTSGTQSIINEAIRAQADQAISAAEQLLDFDDEHEAAEPVDSLVGRMSTLEVTPRTPMGNGNSNGASPTTPGRASLALATPGQNCHAARPGYDLLRTPVNAGNGTRAIWEDSPKNQAMTPKFLEKLKGRSHERGWWARQRQLLEKASPLRPTSPSPASAISADLDALTSGNVEMRNLQKLALFSSEHDVPLSTGESDETEGDDMEREAAMRVWKENRLFDRLWEGLMQFLQPDRPKDLLEQALVLLWEMVQHQWALFEDKEEELVDALFRLRASSSHTILESTNSLLSLLTSATDCVLLLTTLRTGLETYLASHSPGTASTASASLFALNGIGMCILRLPASVVEIEAARLEGIVMGSLASETVTTRQAANTVLLAIQCVLGNDTRTLALFPGLSGAQRNLATYLMETNGLLQCATACSAEAEMKREVERVEERKQRVLTEMEGQMVKGVSGE